MALGPPLWRVRYTLLPLRRIGGVRRGVIRKNVTLRGTSSKAIKPSPAGVGIKATWLGLEALHVGAASIRVTFQGIETLHSGSANIQVTWEGVEALHSGSASEQVTWFGVEVLRSIALAPHISKLLISQRQRFLRDYKRWHKAQRPRYTAKKFVFIPQNSIIPTRQLQAQRQRFVVSKASHKTRALHRSRRFASPIILDSGFVTILW